MRVMHQCSRKFIPLLRNVVSCIYCSLQMKFPVDDDRLCIIYKWMIFPILPEDAIAPFCDDKNQIKCMGTIINNVMVR